MQKQKKILLVIIAFATVATTLVVFSTRSGSVLAVQDDPDQDQQPVAEYAADNNANAVRRAKGSRYDKRGGEPIRELPAGLNASPVHAHFWVGLPPLPAAQSDLVVLGEVVEAQAYLSNDKTGVYSEFTIRAEEVLQNNTGLSLAPAGLIVAERRGGAVRFPSGRIQHYKTHRQGMPQNGRRYLFFLKQNAQAQDFSIVTGYELRAGRVIPLDGEDVKDKRAELPFAKYRGAAESTFLSAVHEAIAQALQTKSEPGGPTP